jgi:hypothetical protein
MKKLFLMTMLVLIMVSLFSRNTPLVVKNPDRPLKGEWDLKLKKEWQVINAGEALIGGIIKIVVNDAGTVFVHDEKNSKFFIFDKDGKFVKAFGIEGEGPGDIKNIRHAITFEVNGKLVIGDISKISYFTYDGTFIRSVRNDFFRRQPRVFISEDLFLTAPIGLLEVPPDNPVGKLAIINLKTGKETLITNFKVYAGGAAADRGRTRVMVMPGLTPIMIIGFHNDRIYYGRNDSYVINVADLNGKHLKTFSIKNRKKKRMSDDEKLNIFVHHDWPSGVKRQVAEGIPNDFTYFNHIKVHNGLIYVYEAHVTSVDSIRIDIFSLDGKYLYKAHVRPEKGLKIIPATEGVVIKNGYIYIALENEDGDQMVGKYKISLPKE